MPIDANVLQMLANPPMLKLDDPLDQMTKAATNAFNMEKAIESRRTRDRAATVDRVMRENTDAKGNVNRGGARRGMADADVGGEIAAFDKTMSDVDHNAVLALKGKLEAREKLFTETSKMLTGVSQDPKVGPMQMMDILESTFPNMVAVMGEEQAERMLNQRVEMLAQNVDENKWPVFLENEQLGIAGAIKRHQADAELAHKKVLEQGRNVRQDKVAATQAELLKRRQDAEKKRQDERITAQARLRATADAAAAARQTNSFVQQDRSQAAGFAHQDASQNLTIKTQKQLQRERITAQKEQALDAAERARKKAEDDIKRKRNEAQAIGASIVAKDISEKFPEFQPQGVMGTEGDAGWIKLNVMPSVRGGPDKIELQMFKKYLASKGMAYVQGELGQPSWVVPAGRLDAQTLRKGPSATKPPKLVVGEDGTLVEAKVGQKVKTPNIKRPNFNKMAKEMFDALYKSPGYPGMSGSEGRELERLREHVVATWEHENNGGPKPPPLDTASTGRDILRIHNAFLEYRKKQSQINRNDRTGTR